MASRSQTRLEVDGDIDIGEELEAVELMLDRCKVLYEQHFMGIQKRAPETLHRQVERRMLKLTQHQIRNTALRFRFTTLSQKFGSYNTYWKRTMRAIEQGRYTRHLAMAARRQQARGKEMPDEMLDKLPKRLRERILRDRERVAARAERERGRKVRDPTPHRHEISMDDIGDDVDFEAMFDAIRTEKSDRQPAAPAPKPAPKPARPPQPQPPGMSEGQTRALFDKFVKAKKLVGDRTDNVTYDKLLRTLNKQAPTIMKQHRARSVGFDVVIKDDKVILKAKPKK